MATDKKMVVFKGTALPSMDLGSGFDKALERASESIETSSGLPFLKLDKAAEWKYGQNDTYVQDGSLWAVNPGTFMKGYVAWKGGKPISRKMKNIREGEVFVSELADLGAEWKEHVGFTMQCMNGDDAGTVVIYDNGSLGGHEAWKNLIEMLRKQLRENRDMIVPLVELKSTSYQHAEWGKINKPVFEIKEWRSYSGSGEPAQPEASPEDESPKDQPQAQAASAKANGAGRRRVAAAPVTDVEDEAEPEASSPGKAAEPVQRRRRRAAAS